MAILREAVPTDLPAIGHILEEMAAEYSVLLPDVFIPATGLAPTLEEDPNQVRIVAEIDGQVVGFAYGKVIPQTPNPVFFPKCIASLEELGVLSGFRDRGIGSLLLQAFTEWAQVQGAETMRLNVYAASPRAVAFYERHGFTPLAFRMSKPLA